MLYRNWIMWKNKTKVEERDGHLHRFSVTEASAVRIQKFEGNMTANLLIIWDSSARLDSFAQNERIWKEYKSWRSYNNNYVIFCEQKRKHPFATVMSEGRRKEHLTRKRIFIAWVRERATTWGRAETTGVFVTTRLRVETNCVWHRR